MDFSLRVFRLILACAAHVVGTKTHRLKSVLLGAFFARGGDRQGRKTRALHKRHEECGTRKCNHPQNLARPLAQGLV